MDNVQALPLDGIRVLDLSTLLPRPLATLMLAEAGADVVKLERPGGDEMRSYVPKFGEASANYAVLNRGKRAYAADFKDPDQFESVLKLASETDVVLEQFRPGVMDRLGLGYEKIRSINPRVVYCSITGYGPSGINACRAGHDLNYLAETGLLSVVVDSDGKPPIPLAPMADIAGETYPALVNILLALRLRDRTGHGAHLHISMTHNLHTLMYGYFATHQASGRWPRPGVELLTGGSPRYPVYETADGRHVACAALEQKFWERLVDLVELDAQFHDDAGQEEAVIAALAERFAAEPAKHWQTVLTGEDVCAVIVATWDEGVNNGLVNVQAPERVSAPDGSSFSTLPSSIDPALREVGTTRPYPCLASVPTDGWPSQHEY
ncbi:CoA transferase [Streptomyces sp. PSKA54]|uniref:CoA transferase n=2 Tax=Streptomyces TaxID=1883 RepID=A0A7W2D9K8_9ACTN|nr:CoA transferase [Streptomyces himalayensis subsp. aureolus]